MFKKDKEHLKFKRIIKYCQLMNYDYKDILSMSDHELSLWYKRVVNLTSNETDFRINTGMHIEDRFRMGE